MRYMLGNNLFSRLRKTMPTETALSRNARTLRYVAYAGLALVVAATLYGVSGALLGQGAMEAGTGTPVAASSGAQDAIVLIATGVPFALALWELSRMLDRAEQGEIFSQSTITHLRRFAMFVLVTAIISICLAPILAIGGALVTGQGLEQVTVSFDAGDIFILLVSALLFFVARLFEEAQRIADENRQIV
jgi:hypothetical protein